MSTLESLAVCLILLTLCWTVVLLQTFRESRARFLMGMVGLVAIFHGVRLLTDSGIGEFSAVAPYEGVVDLVVALLTFAALLIVNTEATSHRTTRVCLRLAQAMEPPVPVVNKSAVSRVFENASPRARAEGAPKRSPEEAALERLMDSAPVALVAFDASGRVCLSNAAADTLFGVNRGQLVGMSLPGLPAAPPRPPAQSTLKPAPAHS